MRVEDIDDPKLRERIRRQIAREDAVKGRDTSENANLESDTSNAAVAEKDGPRFDSQVCLSIHSIRKRLADPDGICGKYAIDGLVVGGILADDNAKRIKKVSFSQEKGKEEKTIITIYD